MKILIVKGEDFGTIHFEANHGGKKASDIIENLDAHSVENSDCDSDEYWELSIGEIPDEVSVETVKFFKNQREYDSTKHETYYHPEETI